MSKAEAYYSPIQIARMALTFVGASPIQSFEDNTPEAIACRDVWPLARDAALQEYPWFFARGHKRLTPLALSEDVDVPYGYSLYLLPSECLRVIKVKDDKVEIELKEWKIYNKLLAIKREDPVYIEYIFSSNDTTLWPPMFCVAVAYKMASMLAGGMNIDMVAPLTTLYGQAIQTAITRELDQVPENEDCILNPLQLARLRA